MSNLDGKQLSYAVLHFPIFIPDKGAMGPTLSSTANPNGPAVKMTIQEPWVILEVKDKKGRTRIVPVPITSFTHTELAPEAKS